MYKAIALHNMIVSGAVGLGPPTLSRILHTRPQCKKAKVWLIGYHLGWLNHQTLLGLKNVFCYLDDILLVDTTAV